MQGILFENVVVENVGHVVSASMCFKWFNGQVLSHVHKREERQDNKWNISLFNSSPPGQNGRHFTDDIFKCIFMNEKFYILI